MSLILLTILVLTASLSPLCTLAALWQIKEWRWDRLREHMQETSWLQFTGKVRPGLLIIFVILSQYFVLSILYLVLLFFITLTALNAVQILLKKQHYPVWTKKALILTATTFILTICIGYIILNTKYKILVISLPLLQPLILAFALVLWKPVDYILKQRILRRAKQIRLQYPHLTVIGITGSVGKTTTKELLAHLLHDLHPLVTPEHVNTELGVAKWLIQQLSVFSLQSSVNMLKADRCRLIAIAEMGAYKKGEIKTLCEITQPTIGIITYIGSQHLGLFGSKENIAQAKGELFEALPENGHAFMSADSPFLEELKTKCRCPYTIIEKSTSLGNPHFNADLAIAAAQYLGIDEQQINDQLSTFSLPNHTFSIYEEQGITILDDTYNSSPASFRAAIEWAKEQPHPHKILLATGIIELGKESHRIHEELGALAAPIFSKALILNQHAAKAFVKGFGKPLLTTHYSLPIDSLLVCIGRIPPSLIKKFL